MKLLTFATPSEPRLPRLGALTGDQTVVDLNAARDWAIATQRLPVDALPVSMFDLIQAGFPALDNIRNLLIALEVGDPAEMMAPDNQRVGYRPGESIPYPPLPRPMSVRDFYAFEAHVATAHANRGKQVPAEWYQFPVFYFSNPNSIYGPGETVVYPRYSQALDYELEVACVISKPGVNIKAEQAEEFIFGYLIFNDWSARDVQRQEMRVGLGPAKGKDFASSIGPWIVTPDELQDRHTGRPGRLRPGHVRPGERRAALPGQLAKPALLVRRDDRPGLGGHLVAAGRPDRLRHSWRRLPAGAHPGRRSLAAAGRYRRTGNRTSRRAA